jgi:hypothetical protein
MRGDPAAAQEECMKYWKHAIGALVVAMPTALPAQADLFTVAQGRAGNNVGVRAYGLDMSHDPRTFSAFAHTPGRHLLLPVGELGAGSSTGLRPVVVKPSLAPEPAVWLTIGVGVILIGVVKLRAGDHFG